MVKVNDGRLNSPHLNEIWYELMHLKGNNAHKASNQQIFETKLRHHIYMSI